jgi:hypothetical protein
VILDVIKGHMGGNTIALLYGEQLPAGRELELSVKALGQNYLWCHEAGLLYPSAAGGNRLRAKISEPTVPSFISACGGMTQVLGKALVETNLGKKLGIKLSEPVSEVIVETDAGPTRLEIYIDGGKAVRVLTDLSAFLGECLERGVRPWKLQGVELYQAGVVMVVDAEEVKRAYPRVDFFNWDAPTRDLLTRIQEEFREKTGVSDYCITLYDWNPERGGDLRVLFPHCISQDYFEPACGTGSVALGAALVCSGELARRRGMAEGRVKLNLEAGGGIGMGGPDTTEVFLEVSGGLPVHASFSHSLVEITLTGKLYL